MTLLGKCLTALILILSVGFAALALVATASHKNWRDVVLKGQNGEIGLKAQIEEISNKNDQLEKQKSRTEDALARERVSRKTALAALQTQLDKYKDELSRSGAEVEALTSQVTKLVSDNETKTKQKSQRGQRPLRPSETSRRPETSSSPPLDPSEMNVLRGFKQR